MFSGSFKSNSFRSKKPQKHVNKARDSELERGSVSSVQSTDNSQMHREPAKLTYTKRNGEILEFVISSSSITIGRSEDNTVCIPDKAVAKHHAEVVRRGDRYFIQHLENSAHYKVLINGDKIERLLDMELFESDVVTIGPMSLLFCQGPMMAVLDISEEDEEKQVSEEEKEVESKVKAPTKKKLPRGKKTVFLFGAWTYDYRYLVHPLLLFLIMVVFGVSGYTSYIANAASILRLI